MTKFSKSSFDINDKDTVSIIDELPLWSAPFGLLLLDAIILKPKITALDIGFGLGFPLIEVAQRLGNSSLVYGIDPWKAAIERTKLKIDKLGIKNVKLIEGAAENIPLPDDSVDLIVSNNGINNVQNLERVISECKRIAKPSAQVLATVNLDGTMIEFYNQLEQVLFNLELKDSILKVKNHIYEKRKPLEELIELFEKNTFKVERIKKSEFYYRYLDGTTMFNHSLIRIAFLDSWLELVPANRMQEIFEKVEEELNKTATEKGQLTFTVPFVLIEAIKS